MFLADRLAVELGDVAAPRNYGDEIWGAGDYGAAVAWTDLRCVVADVTIDAGRTAGLEPAQVGRMVLTVSQWRPAAGAPLIGRTVRLLALRFEANDPPEGRWVQVFTGTIEDAATQVIGTGSEPVTLWTLTVVDVTARLGWIVLDDGALVAPAEQAQVRILRLLALAGTSAVIDGTAPAGGQVEARTPAGPLLDELRVTLESAASIVYARPSGELVVTGEDPWQTGIPPAQFAGTFTPWAAAPTRADADTVATSTGVRWLGCPTSQRLTLAAASIRNRVRLSNELGGIAVAESVVSESSYGRRDWTRTVIDTNTLDTRAAAILARYADPATRIAETVVDFTGRRDTVTVDPDPVDLAVALTRLTVGVWVELWTPPDRTDVRRRGGSRALGYRWRITPTGPVTLTVFTDAVARQET